MWLSFVITINLFSGELTFTSDEQTLIESTCTNLALDQAAMSNLCEDVIQIIISYFQRTETLQEPADFFFEVML